MRVRKLIFSMFAFTMVAGLWVASAPDSRATTSRLNSYPKTSFKPDWKSLSRDVIPEWMKDAKFGVYTHWGVYSVPAHGGPDYIKNLYGGPENGRKEVYAYHTNKYGSLEEFGYKDFIPKFTADEFNADEWVGLMHEAGAKFGGICLVHHDGFCLWDSDHTRWNSMDMGPHRNIYGEIAEAVRRYNDMKLLATFHHGRTFGYASGFMRKGEITDEMRENWDIFDPNFADFYRWEGNGGTAEDFGAEWVAKIREVINGYSPDAIWFDGLGGAMRNNHPSEQQVEDVLAYYYNRAAQRGQDVTVCNKMAGGSFNFTNSFGLRCFENGRNMPLDVKPWFLIDRAIGYPWCYVNNKGYRDGPDYHTKSLVDLVSRGGIFLLSLTPMGNGEVPPREKEIMRGIGSWLDINGEAIYATRPWKVTGEGPAEMLHYNEKKDRMDWHYRQEFSAQDIRFTRSKDGQTLYATALNWPENGKIVIKSLKKGSNLRVKPIKSVKMFGCDDSLDWKRTRQGLEINLPDDKPAGCKWAYSFKIK